MRIKNVQRGVGLVGAACMIASGCSGSDSEGGTSSELAGGDDPSAVNVPYQGDGTPARGGVLTFARGVQPASFTPWIGNGNPELMVQMQVYDQLIDASPNPTNLEPGLAKSWTISPDKLTYTFKLRSGVRFSNGQPLKASDVEFSLESVSNPEIDPNRSQLLGVIDTVTVVDPSTVEVTLEKVTTAFLDYLTLVHILPESEIRRLGPEEFGRHPVGTGPFMVTSFEPGNPTLQLERNPHYWRKGQPYLDGITYEYIPDDNARMLAVESGSADVADGVPFSQIDRVDQASDADVFAQNAFAASWILVNHDHGPLAKAEVRRALVHATPLDTIAKVAYHAAATPAATANMPTSYLDRSIEPLAYDTEKAKQLLDQAGEDSLSLTLTTVSGDAVGKQVATILQASWSEAGIDLEIQERDYASAIDAWVNQDYELVMLRPTDQTSDIRLDDEFDTFVSAEPRPGTFPFTGWDNPKARALIQEATSTFDEKVRRENFLAYQRLLLQEQPIIGLVHVLNLFAVRTNVHNLVAVGTFWPLLEQVWLSE